MTNTVLIQPTKIERHSETEMYLEWNNGTRYTLSFIELRYHCPCAGCVDEHSGKRTIQRTQISPNIRPTEITPVGRYALAIGFSDKHNTGMYHFDRLYELCEKQGRKLSEPAQSRI